MDVADFLVAHEPAVRLTAFAIAFAAMAAWEAAAPRRARTLPRRARWPANIALVVLDAAIVRLLFPLAAVGMAGLAHALGWGLFHVVAVPPIVAVVVSLVALDFAVWLQHVMFHAIPVLWRVHRVHHADLDYDVTTGARFHPIEIVLSMGVKFAAIALLGPPVAAVVAFEVLLNATSMFNHGNVRLPAALDRVLRAVVVTPDMHRVHHSVNPDETNSNFGFNLPWWDRLFGTYRAQPRAGHEAMTIGLATLREPREVARLAGMLALPFRGRASGSTFDRRARDDGARD